MFWTLLRLAVVLIALWVLFGAVWTGVSGRANLEAARECADRTGWVLERDGFRQHCVRRAR